MTWPGKFPIVRANSASEEIFQPDVILGSSLWKWHRLLDGDPALTLSSGVVTWPCKANNGELFQFTAARRPAYSATIFNGGPGITGDGTAGATMDWMRLSPAATVPIVQGTRPYMWVVAKRESAPAAFQTIIGMYNGESHRLFIYHTNTGQWQFERRTTGDNAFTNTGAADANSHLFETGFTTGGLNSHVVDGVGTASVGTNAVDAPISQITIFATEISSFPGNITIAEIVISTTEPTPLQLTRMRAYFGSIPHYGLTIA